MNLIENTIKQIIEDQGLLYFRTVNINDLNERVGTKDVSQGIGVYSSLPEIELTTYAQSNNILMMYDITVFYLKLNNETDDLGEDIDIILNDLYPSASQFYDRLVASGIVATGQFIDGYTMKATDTLKITKEVLTGWQIELAIPIFRKDFYCTI
jgi:hypothetical protein